VPDEHISVVTTSRLRHYIDRVSAAEQLAERAERLCARALAGAEMYLDDVEIFLWHQPMSWFSALMSDTLEEYGNVNASSLGASMHHAREAGRLARGSRAFLFNPAAGYTYAGAAIRW
jgi:3-oxoacyl-[acyl-carrier-protein] synthase III